MYQTVEAYYEPEDIFGKVKENKSELTQKERGFLCGLIQRFRPHKVVEVGVSAGGTSVLLLNCMDKLGLHYTMHSVDLAERYHLDSDEKCGFLIDEAAEYLDILKSHTLYLGQSIAQRIPEIMADGEKIDFLMLDTIHYLPGELLDFLACFPFLAKDAVVVLDDLTFCHWGENPWAFATKILFDTVVGEKYFCDTSEYSSLGAIQINDDTGKYIRNVFSALLTPWFYRMQEIEIEPYRTILQEHYNEECLEFFEEAVKRNTVLVEKKRKISEELGVILKLAQKRKIFCYGAGKRGRALTGFLEDRGLPISGYVISDDRSVKEFEMLKHKVYHLSEIQLDPEEYMVLIAAASHDIRKNIQRAKVPYRDLPNYIFPFLKEYVETLRLI